VSGTKIVHGTPQLELNPTEPGGGWQQAMLLQLAVLWHRQSKCHDSHRLPVLQLWPAGLHLAAPVYERCKTPQHSWLCGSWERICRARCSPFQPALLLAAPVLWL
jgi:hypothetical protein